MLKRWNFLKTGFYEGIKTYLPYEPDQQLLLPAALQEWLPDDHLGYFISDVVSMSKEPPATSSSIGLGVPPYHPRMMVVLLNGYCGGWRPLAA